MEPILTKYIREPNSYTLDFYLKHEGYEGLKKTLAMQPNDVIEIVKASGLRGRGGAGFPTGLKWQFVDKKTPKPKYIACNADESEPGTFKDHVLMERNPHLLFEGCLIGCWAIGAKVAYIYIRGEFYHVQQVLEAELAKAYAQGYCGKNIMGSGFDCDIVIHRGAGAYEAGEETALIESLEGKRAQPRIKPPFPAVVGPLQLPDRRQQRRNALQPAVDHDQRRGVVRQAGPREERRARSCICVSGHVKKPGVFEASMSTTLKELIFDHAGGIRDGHQLKAVIPGGSSVPILLPDQLDIPASFDDVPKAGSMLGSAGIIVMDETTCMVWAAQNLLHFYKHESCGKCTPCREGGDWLLKILSKIERGEGEMRDLDLLSSVVQQHRRQDALRVRRRRGDAGADHAEALPRRVRGAHPRRTLHGAGRLARGAARRWRRTDDESALPSTRRSSRSWC